jgi:hypothetical protein
MESTRPKGRRRLPTRNEGGLVNAVFPGEGEICKWGKGDNIAVFGTLFETPTVKGIKGKIAPDHLTINL